MKYRSYGMKPYRIVVVHAGPGFQGSAAGLARELSTRYSVIEPIQTRKSINELVDELRDIIFKEAQEKVIMIGHGWGAWLSVIFAAQYPDCVKKLILIGTLPLSDMYIPEVELFREYHFNAENFVKYRKTKQILHSSDSLHKNEALMELGEICKISDEFQPFVNDDDIDDLITVDGEQFEKVYHEIDELRTSKQILDYFSKVCCPICIMHGRYDAHPFVGVVEPLLQNRIPHALSLIENCGHTPWREKIAHDDFIQAIYYEIEMIREEKEINDNIFRY